MVIKKGSEGQSIIPAGVHHAVCYGVADLGTQKSSNPEFADNKKMTLLFELPFERAVFGDKGEQPRGTSITVTQSLSEKATLRRHLKSWRGRDFTDQELAGFDPKVLIGVNAQLNIVHEKKGDKTYTNIVSIMPLSKGQEKRKAENQSLYFSLDDQDLLNIKFPENMPKWLQEKAAFCNEVVEAQGGVNDGFEAPSQNNVASEAARLAHEEESRNASNASQRAAAHKNNPVIADTGADEEVPF
jgi:hypothetical protein